MLPLRAGAADVLQCVPYARTVSGVDLRGDALTWWDQAENRFKRGHKPKKGAVLAFRPYGPMTLGHVAVVSKVLGDRQVLVRHANWSAPGAIEEDVLAIDVSEQGDWSAVRVWHSPTGQMGARTNPTFGFIYPVKSTLHAFVPDDSLGASVRLASNGSPTGRGTMGAVRTTGHAEPGRMAAPAKAAPADPFIVEYESASNRSLGDIVNDLKREASL
ncbi:CHAP domain-containing protein [Sphingobium sp. AN641]|uniref:CHAP domain-containing protein n=1 Tax=Sphingobium sp. AN641 TaxID=3133443 RepID=UPI0030BA60CD